MTRMLWMWKCPRCVRHYWERLEALNCCPVTNTSVGRYRYYPPDPER